jgi:hypothetical protein
MSYQIVESVTLTATATSVTFSGIPQDATDLYLLISVRSTAQSSIEVRLNGDANTYLTRTSHSASTTSSSLVEWATRNTDPGDVFSLIKVRIPNYTTGLTKAYAADAAGAQPTDLPVPRGLGVHYNGSSAITSVVIHGGAGATNDLRSGSTFTLYKLKI